MNTYRHNTERKAFLILLGLLCLAGMYMVYPFVNVLILSVVFVVLLHPLHRRYLRFAGHRRNVAALLSVGSVVFFLLLPVAVILTLVTTQLASAVNVSVNLQEPVTMSGYLAQLQEKLNFWGGKLEAWLQVDIHLAPLLQQAMTRVAQNLAKYSPRVVAETFGFFLHFFIMLIVSFYLFRDGADFFALLVRISPIKDQYEHHLAGEIRASIASTFYGSFLIGLIQAVLATLGFYFAGVPGFFVWGAVTFFMSFLPMLGTGAVFVPLTLLLLLKGNVKQATFLLGYGVLVIGSADNLLRPFLIRSHTHPLLLFLSIFGGLAVFGAIGLLLGPMLMAMLTATVKIYAQDFTQKTL